MIKCSLISAVTLPAQGQSGQSTLSNDPALQSPAHSRPERGQRILGSSSRWWLLLVGLIAAALCAPFFRSVYGMSGDEGVLLNGAERMLRGSRIYVDFFEFLPPGGFVLTAAWFSIAGISVGSARSLAILTIVGIACFTYLACWQASKNAPLSAVLATFWVVMSQGALTGVSHHWLTTLFSMVAAWAALANIEHARHWLRWPLIAGAAAGMAAMVTPHRGALAMLAAATAFLNLRRPRTELIAYLFACALVPAAMLAYVIGHHALAAAFDDVIRFTAGRYWPIQIVPFGFGGLNPPLKILFPLTALLTLLVCTPDWRNCLRDRLLLSCAAFAVASFLGCFPRPDLAHIAFAAPLTFPLLACCMSRLTQRWRPMWWRYRYIVVVAAGVVIGFVGISVIHFLQISQGALRAEIVPTPRGRVAFINHPGAPELVARIAATPSADAFFFYPLDAMLSFLTAREQVSKYENFMPEYMLPDQYQDACKSVMRHASWVVIDRRWTLNVLKMWFPEMRDTKPQETKRFEQVLDGGFELVAQEGKFELRRRREGIGDTVCAGIAE